MAIIRTAQFGHGTMDMEFLGLSMERQPQILQELIVSRWAHLPLSTLFSGIYGESPNEEMLPSNMVRWKVLGIPFKPVYVLSTTGTPRVGQEFEITASDSSLYPGAKVRLEDGKTLLYIKGQKTAGPNSCTYTVQAVGNNEADVVDSTLLEKGRALNYVAANYEEGSETGHPITWGTGDHYVNALTTIRHKFQITGDALTEALCMEMSKPDASVPGGQKIFRGYLPNVVTDSGQTLLDFHMEAVERDLVFGKANFDPSTGAIFNTAANGKPVLMGDGLLRQFDSSYTVLYYPTDQISAIRGALDRALAYLAYNTGQDVIDYYFIGGAGAKYIFNRAMQDFLQTSGQRVILNIEKSPVTVAGLNVETYRTAFGSIKFLMSDAFNNPTTKTTEVVIDGMKLPAESFDMHGFPVKRMSNGKTNIRVFAKAKASGGRMVNRSLVFGHIQGMSGFGLTTKQQSELAQYQNLVSTGRDSEQFEVLSQKGLIVSNPSECVRVLVMR